MSQAIYATAPRDFITGLKTHDRELLQKITTQDVVWSIPGSSLVSGEFHQVDGILTRSTLFKEYGVTLEVLHLLTGFNGSAIMLHNTGNHNGRVLDEYLTTVCHFSGQRIQRFDTYISDVGMLDAYFA